MAHRSGLFCILGIVFYNVAVTVAGNGEADKRNGLEKKQGFIK